METLDADQVIAGEIARRDDGVMHARAGVLDEPHDRRAHIRVEEVSGLRAQVWSTWNACGPST